MSWRREGVYPLPTDDPAVMLSTFDLGVAAALVHSGFGLVTLDRTNPKKIRFVFHRDRFADKTMDDYWSGKLRVGAREFFDTLKMLKNRIYSE